MSRKSAGAIIMIASADVKPYLITAKNVSIYSNNHRLSRWLLLYNCVNTDKVKTVIYIGLINQDNVIRIFASD